MRERGVSLIEVMVAFCILSIAFLFLLSSLPLMSASIKTSENAKGASFVGGDILERVRSTPFTSIMAAWGNKKGEKSFSGATNGVSYTVSYLYAVDVSPAAVDLTGQHLLDITVLVSWEERGRIKKIPLQTMVYNSTAP
jgi:Tfp pilus assembly protein PilV